MRIESGREVALSDKPIDREDKRRATTPRNVAQNVTRALAFQRKSPGSGNQARPAADRHSRPVCGHFFTGK